MSETDAARFPMPDCEAPDLAAVAVARGLSGEERRRLEHFHRHGYLVVEGLFTAARVDEVRAQVEPLLAGTDPDPRRSTGRFQDAWQDAPAVRAMATDERVSAILRGLYGRGPIPFQTLNFRVGTEQRAHADTIHFSSIPRRYLCGVWVALEDVGAANGSLVYYPGSHRLPEHDYDDLGLRVINPQRGEPLEGLTYVDHERYEDFVEAQLADHGLERVTLEARKGSALFWAAGLVHGGGPILEPGRTRWSQVTHYYFEDCVYFAPICSNAATGDLHLKRVVDVRTGEPVVHRYRGLPLPPVERDGTYKLYLDLVDGRDAVGLISNHEIKHLADDNRFLRGVQAENANLWQMKANLEESIRTVQRSPSYRLARLATAPLRLLRGRR